MFLHCLSRQVVLIGALLCLFTFALANDLTADYLNATGAGCVDPQGFVDCYSTQETQLSSCVKVANETCTDTDAHFQTCAAGCQGAWLASNIGCWLQSCWNQVDSCEYQTTAIRYLKGVDLVPSTVQIPFYPPPDGDSPGGCSCNMGYVYSNLSVKAGFTDHCLSVAESGSATAFGECICCQASADLNNILHACPKSNLSIFNIEGNLATVQNTMSSRSTDNCAILDDSQSVAYCAQIYGVDDLVGPLVINPLNLPADEPGSEPLHNLPGTPTFTEKPDVLTLTLQPGYTSTITPAEYDKDIAVGTVGGSVAGGSQTEAGTETGSAASTPSGKTSGAPTGIGTGTGAAASPSQSKPGGGSAIRISFSMAGYLSAVALFWLL